MEPEEKLKEVLRLVFVKVGLRAANFPKDEEKAVLHAHILSNYGNHKASEILLAFEMAMDGKLDAEINHYENFSCLYFSQIMNAYRKWAADAYRQNVKETPMIENKETWSDKTMEEWYAATAKQVKEGTLALSLVSVQLSEWMIGKGWIDSKPYEKEAAIRIGKNLAAKVGIENGTEEYNNYKKMYLSGCIEGKYVQEIDRLAKKMAAWDYILKTENGEGVTATGN